MDRVLEDVAASRAHNDASVGAERASADSARQLKVGKAAQVLVLARKVREVLDAEDRSPPTLRMDEQRPE